MAACSDYNQLTKFDKSMYNSIKKSIFHVTQKLGSGVVSPVPYDTAWVARVPVKNTVQPAFPECLAWLRAHQNTDGGWGTKYPYCPYSDVLNTVSSLLALTQWNYPEDKISIKNGVAALKEMVRHLPHVQTDDGAIEMIISGFVADAHELKLDLDFESFEWFSSIGKKKLAEIKRDLITSKPNQYWTLLEATHGTDLEVEAFRREINRFGLIAARPATTAFILRCARLKGLDFPEAEWKLKEICSQNGGGVPHVVPADNFELCYGLDFLIKAGINPMINIKHAVTQKSIDTLRCRWDPERGIGISDNWPVADIECAQVTTWILKQLRNDKISSIVEDPNLRKARIDEENSILNKLSEYENIRNLRRTGSEHSRENQPQRKPGFAQQHSNYYHHGVGSNVSLFYSLLRFVFQNTDAPNVTSRIMDFLCDHQNPDGGWGGCDRSSLEETAYVCLLIFRLVQIKGNALNMIDFDKLIKFMNDSPGENYPFWRCKVLYASPVLTEVAVNAAKYAIFQLQRLCMMTDALNENDIDIIEAEFWDENSTSSCKTEFLMLRPEVRKNDIQVSKIEIDEICNKVFQGNVIDEKIKKLIDTSLDFSYFCRDFKMSAHDRAMDALNTAFLLFIDDVIDFYPSTAEPSKEIEQLLVVVCQILNGGYENLNQVPAFKFPGVSLLWRWLFYFREVINDNNGKIECMVKTLENFVFKGALIDHKLRCNSIELTAKWYLNVKKLDVGLIDIITFNTIFGKDPIYFGELEDDALFMRYIDCASKAARLLSDVPSVLKDLSFSLAENYCIALLSDYNIPLSHAMKNGAKKGCKELLKMYSLRKLILSRNNQNSAKLEILMRDIEHYVNGCLLWSLSTPRYQSGRKIDTRIIENKIKNKNAPGICVSSLSSSAYGVSMM